MKKFIYPVLANKVAFVTLLVLLLAYATNCGIDGDMVVPASRFRSSMTIAETQKISECKIKQSWNEKLEDAFLSGFLVGGLAFSGKYFLKRDLEFCINSMLAIPCPGTIDELKTDLSIVIGLYCNPEPACILNRHTFPQGGICIR